MNRPAAEMLRLLFVCVLCVGVVGCGPSNRRTYRVTGTVKYDDGKPMTSGTVEFETSDVDPPVTATGELDDQGNFVMGTFKVDDGALPGTHRVAIIPQYIIGNGAERPGSFDMPQVAPKYQSFSTSGLKFTVQEQSNTYDIVVKRTAKDE